MTYIVTLPILWSDAIAIVIALWVVLILYWLWRFFLGLIQ